MVVLPAEGAPHPVEMGKQKRWDSLDVMLAEVAAQTRGGTDFGSDADDDMTPARGIIAGVILAVPLWCLVGLLIWLVLPR
jgi:hypothetical protein